MSKKNPTFLELIREFYPDITVEGAMKILWDLGLNIWTRYDVEELRQKVKAYKESTK